MSQEPVATSSPLGATTLPTDIPAATVGSKAPHILEIPLAFLGVALVIIAIASAVHAAKYEACRAEAAKSGKSDYHCRIRLNRFHR